MLCGKKCWGLTCIECYKKNKWSKLTRRKKGAKW